jgi:hypothetical protein
MMAENTRPEDWFNQVCAALGLFDGARPISPQRVLWEEVLPTIEALKTNNPQAGILVRENERVQFLWREALARQCEEFKRADGFLARWRTCEDQRLSLLRELQELRGKPQAAPARVQSSDVSPETGSAT